MKKESMEKQRSFSVKTIRYLVFSFTISFSLIFLILFSTWVFKSPSSFTQFLASNSLTVHSSKEFNTTSSEFVLKSTALMGNNNRRDEAIDDVTRFEGAQKRESEVTAVNGNSSFTPSGKTLVVDNFTVSYRTKSTDDVTRFEGAQKRESEVTAVTGTYSLTPSGKTLVADNFTVSYSTKSTDDVTRFEGAEKRENEITAVTGNSSFTPSGKALVVDSFNVSYSTKSTVNGSGGLSPVIANSDSVDSKKSDEELQELNDVMDRGNVNATSDVSFERKHSYVRNSVDQKSMVDCDLTRGRWVFDESYPLYTNFTCPFIDEGFNCEGNGRMDKDYMKWRWQPQDCDVPRFNATKMLELIRGKRLVFVGDSINRNQWESMLCLLNGAVKDPKKVYEARGRKITKERNNYCFKFEDYKCTLEFYVSHFLVHEGKARIGKKRGQTLRIDSIDKGSSRWRGADILVFNTAHWWNHHKTKAGINYYQEGDQVYPHLDVSEAFRRALLTWASWVDKNINPHKTRVFFRSSAPSHFSGGLWNSGGHCKEAFRPINETFTSIYPERNLIAEEILRQMKTSVTFLNITRLSDYRPDAHPSIYGRKLVNPGVQDCSHWCLPGVPDNWNELLYYYLQSGMKQVF